VLEVLLDHGAEQGEPLGSAYCALELALAVRRACENLRAYYGEHEIDGTRFLDIWYIYDRQIFCSPTFAAPFKNAAKLVGHLTAVTKYGADWHTIYLRASYKRPDPNEPFHVFGINFGSPNTSNLQCNDMANKTR
jgi:hypothetical protein